MWEPNHRVPYASWGDQWVGYENQTSIQEKVGKKSYFLLKFSIKFVVIV